MKTTHHMILIYLGLFQMFLKSVYKIPWTRKYFSHGEINDKLLFSFSDSVLPLVLFQKNHCLLMKWPELGVRKKNKQN